MTREPQIGDIIQFKSGEDGPWDGWEDHNIIENEFMLSLSMKWCAINPKFVRIVAPRGKPIVIWPKEVDRVDSELAAAQHAAGSSDDA
jgi:hypothetical protein